MQLKNGTILEEGKVYSIQDNGLVRPVLVTAIGKNYFLGIDQIAVQELGEAAEQSWSFNYDWKLYTPEIGFVQALFPDGTVRYLPEAHEAIKTFTNRIIQVFDTEEDMMKYIKTGV